MMICANAASEPKLRVFASCVESVVEYSAPPVSIAGVCAPRPASSSSLYAFSTMSSLSSVRAILSPSIAAVPAAFSSESIDKPASFPLSSSCGFGPVCFLLLRAFSHTAAARSNPADIIAPTTMPAIAPAPSPLSVSSALPLSGFPPPSEMPSPSSPGSARGPWHLMAVFFAANSAPTNVRLKLSDASPSPLSSRNTRRAYKVPGIGGTRLSTVLDLTTRTFGPPSCLSVKFAHKLTYLVLSDSPSSTKRSALTLVTPDRSASPGKPPSSSANAARTSPTSKSTEVSPSPPSITR
mmetsp:Transcript_2135/g.5769  ORF Transcript_2135/g.5769 Transcript_2135/m.5769 type:complete len:295 (-) Transcript_2135:991-1875(-)